MKNNVLITGASGFLGRYILDALLVKEENVYTLGRTVLRNVNSHTHWDIGNDLPTIEQVEYQQVVHVAGKAHMIPKTEAEKAEFFKINYQGTIDLLTSLDKLKDKIKNFVLISTVAVYGLDSGTGISENNSCCPATPYGRSKFQAEEYVLKWCNERGINFLILRLPLIVGANPPGNLGAMKKAIIRSKYPRIKNNIAKKSMVLAYDIANLITQENNKTGIYNLTDGYHPSLNEIETAIEKRVNKKIRIVIPLALLSAFAKIADIVSRITNINMPLNTLKLNKLTSSLTFEDSNARKELNWSPTKVINFIEKEL